MIQVVMEQNGGRPREWNTRGVYLNLYYIVLQQI